jgi:guanylate kinase
MMLLVTGASGVGKSTVRRLIAAPSADQLDGFAACLLDCAPE